MIYRSSILRPDLSSSGLYSEIWHLNFCVGQQIYVLFWCKQNLIQFYFKIPVNVEEYMELLKQNWRIWTQIFFIFYFFIFCFNTWILLRYIEFFIIMENATPHPTPFLIEWSFKKTRKIIIREYFDFWVYKNQ